MPVIERYTFGEGEIDGKIYREDVFVRSGLAAPQPETCDLAGVFVGQDPSSPPAAGDQAALPFRARPLSL
jgi:hypothetical protein